MLTEELLFKFCQETRNFYYRNPNNKLNIDIDNITHLTNTINTKFDSKKQIYVGRAGVPRLIKITSSVKQHVVDVFDI